MKGRSLSFFLAKASYTVIRESNDVVLQRRGISVEFLISSATGRKCLKEVQRQMLVQGLFSLPSIRHTFYAVWNSAMEIGKTPE